MTNNSNNLLSYGEILSKWRKRRRFSQLTFALYADVSARHLSFLETGRASPSRAMALKLADYLKMPKNEINRSLMAAGLSPAYLTRKDVDVDLAPIKQAIDNMILSHMPYPGIVLDRHWNLIDANEAAKKLIVDIGFDGFSNILEALATQSPSQSSIINWEEAVGLTLERVRMEIHEVGEDATLMELEQKLTNQFNKHSNKIGFNRSQAVIPTRFKINETVISLFSTIAQFGSVQDLTLDDIKIELMFPLDQISKNYFK